MRQVRSFRAIALAIALLALGQVLSLPGAAAASAGDPPAVPSEIAVPAGSELLFSRHARGVQIYDCLDGIWRLHAPRALLFDPQSHQAAGTHYGGNDRGLAAGPWWESRDGSRIHGRVLERADSPNANSIPLLLLQVDDRLGTGELTPATHIQRLNTQGGVGPTGGCEVHARREVPYTADYYFYRVP